MSIPAFGLGTFRLQDQVVIDSVSTALELGYRAIDTAQIYENEAAVGGLSPPAVCRVTSCSSRPKSGSRIWPGVLIPSLRDSLVKLQTSYVDLTLIHWPSPNDEVPVAEFMAELLEAKRLGLTRQIGVSNFTVDLMQQAIDAVGADQIATNQIELSPFLQNEKVVAFARQHGIAITSYMTLAYGKALQEETIKRIAARHNATPAQVVPARALKLGYAVILPRPSVKTRKATC